MSRFLNPWATRDEELWSNWEMAGPCLSLILMSAVAMAAVIFPSLT
jgi:hypothetical protein